MKQFVVSDPSHTGSESGTKLIDSFRYLHPTQEKAYTCWSTLLDSRKINYGTRIDYTLVSKFLARCLEKAEVWQQIEGSDHCPVFAELAIDLVASQTVPSLCSCYFSAGKQRKLSDFLVQKSKSSSSTLSSTGGAGTLGKRHGSTVDTPPAAKARKVESGKKKIPTKSSKQSLRSFLQPTAAEKPQQSKGLEDDGSLAETDEDFIESLGEVKPASQENSTDSFGSQGDTGEGGGKKLSQAWMGLFGGPPKPPLCKGHSEPCVLRTVKKQGPNKNKQFWVCARPGGGKGDPEARCDFFQWRSTKQK